MITMKARTEHWRLSGAIQALIDEACVRAYYLPSDRDFLDDSVFDDWIDLFACDVASNLRDRGCEIKWSITPQSRGVGQIVENDLPSVDARHLAEALESTQLHYIDQFTERAKEELESIRRAKSEATSDSAVVVAVKEVQLAVDSLVRLILKGNE